MECSAPALSRHWKYLIQTTRLPDPVQPGQYRISLLKTFKDGFYPGIHLLPDRTIVTTTYATYRQDDGGCSIVSIRFKTSEVDAMNSTAQE